MCPYCHGISLTMHGELLSLNGNCPDCLTGHFVYCDEAVSFWGGVDPNSGIIIDKQHPQYGQSLAGKICFFTQLKGSTAAPGILLEWLCSDAAPLLIITREFEPMVYSAYAMKEAIYTNINSYYSWLKNELNLNYLHENTMAKITRSSLLILTNKSI